MGFASALPTRLLVLDLRCGFQGSRVQQRKRRAMRFRLNKVNCQRASIPARQDRKTSRFRLAFYYTFVPFTRGQFGPGECRGECHDFWWKNRAFDAVSMLSATVPILPRPRSKMGLSPAPKQLLNQRLRTREFLLPTKILKSLWTTPALRAACTQPIRACQCSHQPPDGIVLPTKAPLARSQSNKRLTTQAQPRRNNDATRVSGTDSAHRRWLQRLVRRRFLATTQ